MSDRELRLKATVLQLSRVMHALQDLHRTVLPKDPRMYAILSEADFDMMSRLCADLRDLLGVEFNDPLPLPEGELPSPIVALPTNINPGPTSIAGKE